MTGCSVLQIDLLLGQIWWTWIELSTLNFVKSLPGRDAAYQENTNIPGFQEVISTKVAISQVLL